MIQLKQQSLYGGYTLEDLQQEDSQPASDLSDNPQTAAIEAITQSLMGIAQIQKPTKKEDKQAKKESKEGKKVKKVVDVTNHIEVRQRERLIL